MNALGNLVILAFSAERTPSPLEILWAENRIPTSLGFGALLVLLCYLFVRGLHTQCLAPFILAVGLLLVAGAVEVLYAGSLLGGLFLVAISVVWFSTWAAGRLGGWIGAIYWPRRNQ